MVKIDDIENFWELTPKLAISGQPRLGELEILADAGYQTIINLGLSDASYSLAAEASYLEQLDMAYIAIPVEFKKPHSREYLRFLNSMNLQQEKQVLVHCKNNQRASVFSILYLIMSEQVSQIDGWNMINEFWQPDLVWESFFYQELTNYYKIKDDLVAPVI
ncbi:hypothetical protein MNBD_GAMMA21-2601 [hydrothermal vent metagenome]|uniref:Tyrosine specific protein phosphatases domain-containing protein n=1 Tax=hydrothermal vent metagenome TaxID=652676 RepID=A0A3B1AVY8_9ZZZZ